MSTLAEIEEAIESLPPADFVALTDWLNRRRSICESGSANKTTDWVDHLVGTGTSGMTTDEIMRLTRGEE